MEKTRFRAMVCGCLILAFSFIFCVSANASDLLLPTGVVLSDDPDIKNLQWNRYSTDDFVILSIDNDQGQWMHDNLDKIKSWCLTRWGFPDYKLSKECRLFCVPNKPLFKKLFNLDSSKIEVRDNVYAVWLVLDEKPSKTIPAYISMVCFSEHEARQKVKLGYWFKRGASQLNSSLDNVKDNLLSIKDLIKKDQPMFTSEKLFTLEESWYLKESAENRNIIDRECIALCLLLRKEFGEAKLQGFLRLSNKNVPSDVLRQVYGFNDYNHFDKQYIAFMKDLTNDLAKDKTPDSYLEIRKVK